MARRNTCQIIHNAGKEKPAELLIRRGMRSNPSDCQNVLPARVEAGSVKLRIGRHRAELCTLCDPHVCIMQSVSHLYSEQENGFLTRKKKSLVIFFEPLPYYFMLSSNFSLLSQIRQLTPLTMTNSSTQPSA